MSAIRYPKPEILAQLPPGVHAVIEASAGTGKTYTLEHLVIELLLERGATIDQLLVVTYTEKATLELRARVRAKLEELLRAGASESVAEPSRPAWLLDEGAKRKLHEALLGLDGAVISTIHSFCQRVLTEHAFANGRLFVQAQIDSGEAFASAFRAALREELAGDPTSAAWLTAWLTSGKKLEALEALLHSVQLARATILPPLDRTELGILREALLLLAPKLPAALAELSRLVGKRSLEKVSRCVRKLLELPQLPEGEAGLPALVAHFDEWRHSESGGCVAYLREQLEGARAQSVCGQLRLIATAIGALPTLPSAMAQALLGPVVARLRARKSEEGLFDFDDMLGLVRDGILGPGGPQLVRALRQRFRFALIDEFQDTDDVQWEVFRRLFFESDGESLLYLIGDPKQSIYGFRGADIATYLRAREEVRQAGGAVVALDTNFRSSAPLLEALNGLFDQQAAEPFFSGPIRYETPVKCGEETLAALDAADAPLAPVHVFDLVGISAKPTLQSARLALNQRIAEELQRLLAGTAPSAIASARGGSATRARALTVSRNGVKAPLRASDIFVLTETLKEGLELGEVLRQAGVPHAFFKPDGLFQTDEAEQICHLLEAIAAPDDRALRMRALLTPFFGATIDELAQAGELPHTHPLLQRLQGWKALADRHEHDQLFASILRESGILRRELYLRGSERELTNLTQIFELLLEEASRARLSLPELVRWLQAWRRSERRGDEADVQRLETERDAVQLMTMHKAKGLEAAVVFVAGGFASAQEQSVFAYQGASGERCVAIGKRSDLEPLVLRKVEAAEVEENERLFYVALTRAKVRLYLPRLRSPSGSSEAPPRLRLALGRNAGYALVDRRLGELARPGAPLAERFVIEQVPCEPRPLPRATAHTPATPWLPGPELLAPQPMGPFAQLSRAHRGFFLTSYSRIASAEKAHDEELRLEAMEAHDAPLVSPSEGELPGGAAVGVFLHELLEHAPFAETRGTTLADWMRLPSIARLLRDTSRRHGFAPEHQAQAAALVHAALTLPVPTIRGAALDGISRASQAVPEMEFAYPIPEALHPRLEQSFAAERRPFRIERGLVRGYIDLVYQHDGVVYLCDWKSDRLGDYSEPALREHVERHYRVQVDLYALALARLLSLRTASAHEQRFGGLLYIFLRGLGAPGRGIVHLRQSWSELQQIEAKLQARERWGAVREEAS